MIVCQMQANAAPLDRVTPKICRNFEWPFTPRTWLRSAGNFGKMRFRQFATFHFSTLNFFFEFFVGKHFRSRFFFKKVRFWRSYEFLSMTGTFLAKSYCPNCPYFWGDFLGEGVNDSICVENLDLEPKMKSNIWCYDVLIII